MQNAKAEGVAARQTVARQTYDYKNIDCLPTKYSLESASTKAIGEEIIEFYSKHSPNFHACTFEVDNVIYNSVEQAYQVAKARCAGRDDRSCHRLTV